MNHNHTVAMIVALHTERTIAEIDLTFMLASHQYGLKDTRLLENRIDKLVECIDELEKC